jgi:hypothetical protein
MLAQRDAAINPGALSNIDAVISSTGLSEIASVLAKLLGEERAENTP